VALNASLRLVGQKSGKIQGGVTQKGREGTIAVIALSHEIDAPRDPVTGQATGKRQHRPLSITKELDRSTPILRSVLTSNELLTQCDIQFYGVSRTTGAEAQTFTIRLTNGSIGAIDMEMPNNKHADLMALETFEVVTFTYQKIEWTWIDGGITAMDDWMSPMAYAAGLFSGRHWSSLYFSANGRVSPAIWENCVVRDAILLRSPARAASARAGIRSKALLTPWRNRFQSVDRFSGGLSSASLARYGSYSFADSSSTSATTFC
jgi:type VI secretion system secreted protein Hcp